MGFPELGPRATIRAFVGLYRGPPISGNHHLYMNKDSWARGYHTFVYVVYIYIYIFADYRIQVQENQSEEKVKCAIKTGDITLCRI